MKGKNSNLIRGWVGSVFGYKLKMCSCFPVTPFKDIPGRHWVVDLVIYFVWMKWPEVIVYTGSWATVNGLLAWLVTCLEGEVGKVGFKEV